MRRRLCAFAWLALAGCGGETAPTARIDVRVADVDAIAAAVKAQRGKGLLINHWATW